MKEHIKYLRSSQSPWEHGQKTAQGHHQSPLKEGAGRVQNKWFSRTEQLQLKVLLSTMDVHSSLITMPKRGRHKFPVTEAVLAGTKVRGAVICRDSVCAFKYSCMHVIYGN